jgi:thioredoxin
MRYLVPLLAIFMHMSVSGQVVKTTEFEKGITTAPAQLLDVRTPAEFRNAHLKNSLQADWNNQTEFRDRVQYLDRSKPVYVYCAAGVRSSAAAKWMRANGFASVIELEGWINAWNGEKKPTEGVPAAKQISMEEFNTMVFGSKAVLIDFGAPWCPPCKKMEPITGKLEKDLKSSVRIIKLDPTVQTTLAAQMNVTVLPTFLVYKNGKEVFRKSGVSTYEELKKVVL